MKNRVWKKVTPIPPEYNGHGYLWDCTKCGYSTVYVGKEKYPPYECPNCGNGKMGDRAMKTLINLLAIVVTLNCSAYADHGITASGEPVRQGICAMDKVNGMVVPFGTKVTLPDGRVLIVKDRFGGNFDNHLDIWMPTESECWQFGRRNLLCEVQTP